MIFRAQHLIMIGVRADSGKIKCIAVLRPLGKHVNGWPAGYLTNGLVRCIEDKDISGCISTGGNKRQFKIVG